jgi:hypothetical protein
LRVGYDECDVEHPAEGDGGDGQECVAGVHFLIT